MNNNNQNSNQNLPPQQNTSFSALDALNHQLSIAPTSPPANAKQITTSKNINKGINKNTKKTNKNKPLVNTKKIINKVNSNKNLEKNIQKKDASIDELDEEIKKLEMEIRNKEKNKINNDNVNLNEKNNLQKLENKNEEQKIENQNTDNKETDLRDSKMALIKLLLDAKKSKESTNEIEIKIKSDTDTDTDTDTDSHIYTDENINKNNYIENFNVEEYDPEKIHENQINMMDIEFNENEGAKLIKVIEDEDMNYVVPNNVKIRSSNPNNSFAISRNNVNNFVKGSIYFDIDSEKITSYDCYNDYMIDLEKKIRLSDIAIKSIELPINNSENINMMNNELKIIINNKEQIFELEENYYNRYEIKDFLNEAFNAYNFDITCDIQEGIFIFNSSSKFTMLNHDKSILPSLGFNKNAYVNKNTYIGESPHQIGDNVYYLVIENVSSEPLFYINKDNDEIKKLFDFEPIEIDNLIIKFNKSQKDLIKNSKEYNYFFNDKHLITFELLL